MRSMRKFPLVLALATVLMLIPGCAKRPDAEVTGAETALSGAETAQAQTYASAELTAAQEALDKARAEVQLQDGKFAWFRSYEQSQQLLDEAIAKANAAREAAVAAKEKARQESLSAQEATQQAVNDVGTLIAQIEGCKNRPKGFALDVAAIKGNHEALIEELGSVGQKLGVEDYFAAKSLAESITSSAESLRLDLQEALAKLGC